MAALWIKICGLRTAAAIEVAVVAGADAVGFVFHAPSSRHLEPAEARALQAAVPPGIERVAVFLHPSQVLVDAALEAIAPDWVQTDAGDLDRLRLPAGQRVLPVLRSGSTLPAVLPARCLFESGRSGAGERADWSAAAGLARRTQLVLAGGLDPETVAEAVRTVQPFGVDVSSGVERERGVKDAVLIREFIRAAREAGRTPNPEESRRCEPRH
jgi:phosphoribosylanthranilate isomerase